MPRLSPLPLLTPDLFVTVNRALLVLVAFNNNNSGLSLDAWRLTSDV